MIRMFNTGRMAFIMAFGVVLLMTIPSQAQTKTLQVTSNAASAMVYVDGEWLGTVGDGPFRIPASTRQIRVVPGQGDLWSIDPLVFDLTGDEADPLRLQARFPYVYRIESDPSGAELMAGGVRLGSTPLRLEQREPLAEVIRASLDGYESAERQPGGELWNHVRFDLQQLPASSRAAASGFAVEAPRRDWVSIAATATAFAAGALAIHYRTKADNRYDDYNELGKPSLRSDIRRLDVQSGVALGVMQAGLGVVAIRLAF